jgi:hypothetical protein
MGNAAAAQAPVQPELETLAFEPKPRRFTAGGSLTGAVSARALFTVSVLETGATLPDGAEAFAESATETANVDVAPVTFAPLQTTAVFPPFAAQVMPAGGDPAAGAAGGTVKLYGVRPPEAVYVGAAHAPAEHPVPCPYAR